MIKPRKTYIAEMLLGKNLITREQLDKAMEEQKKSDKKIGQILIDLGYIDETKLLHLVAEQLHIPYIDVKNYPLDPAIVKVLPEFYARHYRAIVLKHDENSYLVGMADPQDLFAHDEIQRQLNSNFSLALIREEDLVDVLDAIYRRADEISHFAETLSAQMKPDAQDIFANIQDLNAADIPVVNLIRSIFEDAVQVGASDIHIEPDKSVMHIRLRVDGVLQEQTLEDKNISQPLVQRIKLISGLNIAEKRLPQDGRFTITVKGKTFDIRVSTLPTQYGESLVMRLLNQSDALLQLDQVGMPEKILDYYKHAITSSYGLILFVGPTGSGKSTTLYSTLNTINSPDDKIITVEDPVEYRLPRINQVQVNPTIGLTFASILRSILRQDPDIIMIGEMRDQETMEIALRAAMTGHLVFATLHTNDTISAATRLLDMGAKGYLAASVLRVIVAQRLVREICDKCITDDPLTEAERIWLKSFGKHEFADVMFKHGKGCSHCHHTGYRGRHGVFELLPISEELADAMRVNNSSLFHHLASKQPLYRPLVLAGLDLAATGITTVQEVIRMTGEI